MSNNKFIFCVGAPGSRWSRLTWLMRNNLANIDNSDATDNRKYFITKYKRWTHQGAFFGPGHDFGGKFDDIKNNYTVESFTEECLKPFSNNNEGIKIIRCHWFSYNDNLNWLRENFKGDQIYLISSTPTECKTHWDDLGGWKISYPNYDWYKNDEYMLEKIHEEYANIINFGNQHNITWYSPLKAAKIYKPPPNINDNQREELYIRKFFSDIVTDNTKWMHSIYTIS